jgi:MFS family permease
MPPEGAAADGPASPSPVDMSAPAAQPRRPRRFSLDVGPVARRYPRQYWLMVVGLLLSNAGGGLVWPYLLIFASARLHLPLATVGSLITIQAVAGMVSSFMAGALADRFGRKPVMVTSLVLSGCVYILLSGANGYAEFAVLMALLGISNPMYQVGADAMLADMIPAEQRAQAYAINRVASNAGFGLGPAVGGFLAATSYSLAFYGAATGFLAYALLCALFAHETLSRYLVTSAPDLVRAVQRRGSIPALRLGGFAAVFGDRPYMAFAGLLCLGLIAPSTVWVLLAVYTKTNFGLPEYLYGWIPTANAVLCVTVQYPVTRVTSRFRPLTVIAVGMTVYAVGAGSVALMTSFEGFLVSMIVLTFGELIVVPTAAKYVADLARPDLRGHYMSVYWLGWAASRAIAPLVGGFLNDRVGPTAIWYGALVIGLASSLGIEALVRRPQPASRSPEPKPSGAGEQGGP